MGNKWELWVTSTLNVPNTFSSSRAADWQSTRKHPLITFIKHTRSQKSQSRVISWSSSSSWWAVAATYLSGIRVGCRWIFVNQLWTKYRYSASCRALWLHVLLWHHVYLSTRALSQNKIRLTSKSNKCALAQGHNTSNVANDTTITTRLIEPHSLCVFLSSMLSCFPFQLSGGRPARWVTNSWHSKKKFFYPQIPKQDTVFKTQVHE